MDDGNSRRSLSPYHEKCFPPYCDNAHQVDKAMVSKMPRGDLEDKYIIFADENLELKKQNRNQERQIQRLQTAIQRQDKMDKRQGVTPASRVADGNLVAILEAQNKNLQAKIKVLKQQLMNHSFIHSKEGRINDSKMRQGLAKTPRESEFQLPSETQSAREAKPDKQVAALKMRIKELEVQLETQKNKHKAQIAQMEKELSALEKEAAKSGTSVNEQLSETSRQVKDNTELIRLRMQAERDAAELAGLQERLRAAGDETDKLQAELQQARDRADDLEKQLDKERNRSRSAVSEASKGTTHMETIRALEEQIRDLQKERDTLKDTNEKLLQLTQTKSEKSLKTASGHSLQISQLENSLKDKMEELEQKEARIKELEQQLEDAEKAREEAVKLAQKPSESGSSKKECSNCEDLSKQLTGSLLDNAKLKALLNEAQKPKTPFPTPEGSGTELNKLKDEVERLQEEADRLRNEADQLRDEVRQLQNEVDQLQGEIEALKDERSNLEHQLSQAHDELDTMRPIVAEHQNCRKSPLPSTSSHDEALRKQNQRLEDELNRAWQELNVLRPIVEEHRNCQRPLDVQTSSKAIQVPPTTSFVSFRVEPEPPVEQLISEHYLAPSEESVHSKKTIDSERYIALSRQLQEALYENDRLKKELEGRDGDDALRRQNQRLEDELNRALMELREVRPIADEHTRVCGHPRKEYIVPEYAKSYVGEYLEPEYAKEYQPQSKEPSVRQVSPAQSYASRAPQHQEHISHVTPPPSVHCVETVNLNDLAQKANLIIVSKHDFEKVLMQKKRYSTEVEVVEPVNERQTLNCKLEICMYDLDIDDRMLEYLSSMQPEPKVYVEWSFVGLDQRTAPLPAEQALFYTNVMYYGPLSSEIKGYLNKVEMPVDLYLVKSSGSPVKVAEGTLDMLPAMEQPNRGFMRSVFMRGKDLPSRYYSDKPVATIHCSFILHECCLGDPPFRDQLEVAIGTLYLKNRDGGVVPDHATHIYIEYALLGHCGPDLETDSVPRGEVMKFNHTKKLRVNEENAPHLKAMLADSNPRPLRFTVLAEPCSLTSDTEVETVGHADINLNEEMIRKDRDLISSQVPVFSNEGEHLGTLSVTVLGIGTLQEVYTDRLQPTR